MSNFLEGSDSYPPHEHDDAGARIFGARIFDDTDEGYAGIGLDYARRINRFLAEQQLSLPEDARYLGLACGQGLGEMTFACKLGIDHPGITLLDKKFSAITLRIMDEMLPEVGLIKAGIFAFLSQPQQKDFSLVSAFGIDYLLDGPRRMKAFITMLPKILRPGAFICIAPYYGKDLGIVWEDNGFISVKLDNHAAIMHFRP